MAVELLLVGPGELQPLALVMLYPESDSFMTSFEERIIFVTDFPRFLPVLGLDSVNGDPDSLDDAADDDASNDAVDGGD